MSAAAAVAGLPKPATAVNYLKTEVVIVPDLPTETDGRIRGTDVDVLLKSETPELPKTDELVGSVLRDDTAEEVTRRARRSLLAAASVLLVLLCHETPPTTLPMLGLDLKPLGFVNALRIHPLYFGSMIGFVYFFWIWGLYARRDYWQFRQAEAGNIQRMRQMAQERLERSAKALPHLNNWLSSRNLGSRPLRAEIYHESLRRLPKKWMDSDEFLEGLNPLVAHDSRALAEAHQNLYGRLKTLRDEHEAWHKSAREYLERLDREHAVPIWWNYTWRVRMELYFPVGFAGLVGLFALIRFVLIPSLS